MAKPKGLQFLGFYTGAVRKAEGVYEHATFFSVREIATGRIYTDKYTPSCESSYAKQYQQWKRALAKKVRPFPTTKAEE